MDLSVLQCFSFDTELYQFNITFFPAIFPLQSKGCKITIVCALLTGLTASVLVALLLVPLCWWLFSIATASSDGSLFNESHLISITNQNSSVSSGNKSLIIDVISNLSIQTTVSSKRSHGIHHYSQKYLRFCTVKLMYIMIQVKYVS